MTKKGFTLIELLVAVTIVVVLSLIGLTVYTGTVNKAKDSKRIKDVDAIASAFEQHYEPGTFKYPAIEDSWFAGGARPKPPEGGHYSFCPSHDPGASFQVCTLLSDDKTYCKRSIYGDLPAACTTTIASGGTGGTGGTSTTSGSFCSVCTADFNRSGAVDGADTSLLNNCTGRSPTDTIPGTTTSCANVDINRDGAINQTDQTCFNLHFAKTCDPKPLSCENFGDVDNNSQLSQNDVKMIEKHVAGTSTLSNEGRIIADVNYDGSTTLGVVDLADAQHLLKYLGNQISQINACQNIKPPPCTGMGDVTGDGKVTAMDAQEALRIAAHIANSIYTGQPYTDDQKIRANVDNNGTVNNIDSLMIQQYLAGTRTTFPACSQ